MSQAKLSSKLDRPVNNDYDHVLGPANAEITLVEYGSYACPYCRAANERIAQVRDQLGDRLRYVFRHYPLTGSDIALRAAELVEHAKDTKSFWDAHVALMTRSETLTEEDLIAVARDLGIPLPDPGKATETDERAKARVQADVKSAQVSHALVTPTFFINGRRYDDPWDESSFADAMLGAPGHRLRGVALDFADWAPSAGVLLLVATILAVALTNSSLGPSFVTLWEQYLGISIGSAEFRMSLLHWINDGLLTIFFLVVGLEIKREFTVGRLASIRSGALPVAAAVGGMMVPAILYLLLIPAGAWSRGWGVPMATDTAFAVALIVMMGNRVPAELRVFLTAASIVDDIGAIIVVAIFYSGTINFGYLAGAAATVAGLALLNRSRIYSVTPYVLLGVVLWALRARKRTSCHYGGRDPGAVHSDEAASESDSVDGPGGRDPDYRGTTQPRGVAARSFSSGDASARRYPRSPGIASRSPAAKRRGPVELRCAAAVCPGQCGSRGYAGCIHRP